jgi:hypothetical protein
MVAKEKENFNGCQGDWITYVVKDRVVNVWIFLPEFVDDELEFGVDVIRVRFREELHR